MIFYENKKFDFRIGDIYEDFSFSSHIHKQLELVLCTKGEFLLTCEREKYVLHERSWLIILPESEHSYISCKKSTGVLIMVNPSVIPRLSAYLTKKLDNPVVVNNNKTVDYCVNALKKQASSVNKNTAVEQGLLYVITGLLFEQCVFSDYAGGHRKDLCADVLRYIPENFKNNISLSQIAKYFGVNASYLSRIFKAKTGYGINDIVNDYRIDYAKYLLVNTNMSITDICYKSGFNTIRSFNRIFAQSEGVSPSVFRKNY